MQQCIKILLFHLHEAQHVSGDTPPIIRSLKLHWQPLVFRMWEAVGRVAGGRCQAHCAWQRPPSTRPTTCHVWNTRGCQCSFRFLMMGSVSPETCWASCKWNNEILIHFCILLDFSLWIITFLNFPFFRRYSYFWALNCQYAFTYTTKESPINNSGNRMTLLLLGKKNCYLTL